MDIYSQNILDHYKNPRHTGILSDSLQRTELNTTCGDDLTLYMKHDGHEITDVAFEGQGCAISQASMSMLAEELMGMSLLDASKLRFSDIKDMLGIPVSTRRAKCATLSLVALKNILRSEGDAVVTFDDVIS